MVELLKQPQYQPMDVIHQGIQLFAGGHGYLDDLPVNKVQAFASDLVDPFAGPAKATRDKLAEAGAIKDDIEKELETAIKQFKDGWAGAPA